MYFSNLKTPFLNVSDHLLNPLQLYFLKSIFYTREQLKIVKEFLLNCKTKNIHCQIHCSPYYIYIHYTPQKHPRFHLKESSLPQSIVGQPKGRDFRKDDFFYRSNSLICLCLLPTTPFFTPLLPYDFCADQ